MQVIRRIGKHPVLALATAALLIDPAFAHTGSGIGVDATGQVYFLDTGSGLWKIDRDGKLSQVSSTRYHWLAVDANDAFATTRMPSVRGSDWDITRACTHPTVLLASDWPIAIGPRGALYYPSGPPGQLKLMRTLPSGESSVFVTFPDSTSGTALPYVNGIAGGPDGSVYYTEDSSIRRIRSKGEISTFATIPELADGPSIPGTPLHPYLRGLAVDPKGVVYVADNGDARVLKITPDGKITTILRTRSPWSPTAVTLFGDDVYVLEFLHTSRDVRADWFPLVRKIAPDGSDTILATIDQMPGARRAVPPPPTAVQDLKAVAQGSAACRLDWKAPAPSGDGDEALLGSVSHYRIERRARKRSGESIEDWGSWAGTSTETSAIVKGLSSDVEYEFRVTAVNAGGRAAPSATAKTVIP